MSEEPKVAPLSAEALEHYRSKHGPMGDLDPDLCKFPTCYHWPCDYGTWLATVDAERQRADRAEAEVARLRAALEAAKVLHVEEWSDACPVAVRQDGCEDCSSEGLPNCGFPCTCSADAHNAAIDRALEEVTDE